MVNCRGHSSTSCGQLGKVLTFFYKTMFNSQLKRFSLKHCHKNMLKKDKELTLKRIPSAVLKSRAEYIRGQGGAAVTRHTAGVVGVGPRAFLYSRAEPAAKAVGRAARSRHVMVGCSDGGWQRVEPAFCQTLKYFSSYSNLKTSLPIS